LRVVGGSVEAVLLQPPVTPARPATKNTHESRFITITVPG
jgi:hypothetical protein